MLFFSHGNFWEKITMENPVKRLRIVFLVAYETEVLLWEMIAYSF